MLADLLGGDVGYKRTVPTYFRQEPDGDWSESCGDGNNNRSHCYALPARRVMLKKIAAKFSGEDEEE